MRARDYQPGELVPGTVYKVMRLIGAGGMGTVYDVEDVTVGKRFVLKTLHPKLGARDDLARRIQKEARTLGRLNHPNIVEVITAGVTTDNMRLPYFVMERLSGQSLRVVLEKKGQLELSHAYHIGIDFLDALDHAHDKGVIHRDVKPDNIFLHRSTAGLTITKLLDFGIVSVLDDGSRRETAGRFLGTLRYAAPEQLRGEKPTPKTDVYATALVLYEIVAGRGPFDDEGEGPSIAAAHMNRPPPPVSQHVGVPREFDVLLMAALAKNADMRPRDAFSFAASLRNLKRRLEEARPRLSADNRVTASAMIAPESSSRLLPLAIGTPTPDSGRLLPPAPALPRGPTVPGYVSSLPPMRPPLTTLVGMPTPTVSLHGDPGAAARDTIGDPVDRAAPTRTISPEALGVSGGSTEAITVTPAASPDRRTPEAVALGEASTEIQWPAERMPVPSIEPQVRSVPATPPQRRLLFGGRFAVQVAAGAVAAVAVFAVVHHATRRVEQAPAAAAAVAPPPPAPVAMPAPSAPARAEEIAAASPPAPSATPVPSGAPVAPAAPASSSRAVPAQAPAAAARPAAPHGKPLAVAVSKAKPVASALYAPDRPGPGF